MGPGDRFGSLMDLVFERPPSQKKKKAKRRQISLSSKGPLMETALFSAASLFHGDDDSDDGRGTTRKSTPTPLAAFPSPSPTTPPKS